MIKFFGAVIIILAAFVTLIYPLANSIKQGLDLQGGTHIVLEAEDTPDAPVTEDSLSRAVTIVERRINEMGLTVTLSSSGFPVGPLPEMRRPPYHR